MWTNKETNKEEQIKNIILKGFDSKNHKPKELLVTDFLSFLISQEEFKSIQALEDHADNENDPNSREKMEKILSKWINL